ncbi:MAG TPA: decaprenyl-phosphate phosphoribosyltransferase [Puia sp.]|uniref:decaprenyl-phosphate phosphoribosyltransferase n=1 Tax=Puia sp. TaxID=2045100 RepID=UPI002BA3DED1|nr:decaprenyl-phosphate phosphoribosyltransferase [Puia sp.]HVU95072.1 decaprenyl-phosphate phosphoribosyltransferase [Puia sp.]
MAYLTLLRPKDWAKNLFLFIPLFFAGDLLDAVKLTLLSLGFFAFSFVASSIYIINDYRDREEDKKHPVKCKRPLASGEVSPKKALTICTMLLLAGSSIAWALNRDFAIVLAAYFLLNLGYSFGLKNISILDIFILALGFVLRIKSGSIISQVPLSEWIIIMVLLLSIFMAIGKRRDDLILKIRSGSDMRKSVKSYNLEFLNTMLAIVAAVIIVAYLMYTLSPEVITRLQTYRLYYTTIFVIAGLMRYLQIIYVTADAGSPTNILYKDRFLQITLLLWIVSFASILYFKDAPFFK